MYSLQNFVLESRKLPFDKGLNNQRKDVKNPNAQKSEIRLPEAWKIHTN